MTARGAETRKRLLELTPDVFEMLATAVLREADPAYRSLIHVGTNIAGKTVQSPVDGITMRLHRSGSRLTLVQHTTTARRDLRHKWLHPEYGDLTKAQAIYTEEAARGAVRSGTVVLTSSVDPDQLLIRDVHAAARQGLKVDIWPGSRIADFLDRNPEGQWIRQLHFGDDAVRLSLSQIVTISGESLAAYLPLVTRDDIVARSVDKDLLSFARSAHGAGFVIGDSGFGKSAALRRLADGWIADGGIALLLDHSMVEQAGTVEQAIVLGLRKWAPSLDAGCGQVALSFATPDRPLLLIVEDINQSANPRLLVERLLGWSGTAQAERRAEQRALEWRLLCPVWRGNASLSDTQLRTHVLNSSFNVERFERSEAIDAVRSQAKSAGVELTGLQCSDLAVALGDDPLLIGLNKDWSAPSPKSAIETYISTKIEMLGDRELLPSELRRALEKLAEYMVLERAIHPTWEDIRSWLRPDPDELSAIRRLIDHGRVVGLGSDERLSYRHDRVRDHLLVRALVRLIESESLPDELWGEPFYAELIGRALPMLPIKTISEARSRNPVAIFAALQDPGVDDERCARLVEAASEWIVSAAFKSEGAEYQRHHALRFLSRTDGPFVIELAEKFENSFWRLEALARNGHLPAAAAICRTSDPGVQDSWRDRTISHALARHPELTAKLDEALRCAEMRPGALEGFLNLTGELGDPSLCDALAERWVKEGGADALSSGWIWATLRCCPPIAHPLADDVARAWAKLPAKRESTSDKRDENPRWDLAGYSLPWAVRRRPEPSLIAFLVGLSNRFRGLSHIVTTILSHVDHPDAVIATVRKAAKIDRRNEGTDRINFLSFDLQRQWSPEQHGQALSAASRVALKELWQSRRRNRFERRKAFQIWSQTPSADEIVELAALETDPHLADLALKARLAAGDQSAVPLLSQRIWSTARGVYWWQNARRVGLSGLRPDVRRYFEERRRSLERGSAKDATADHILSGLLMDAQDDFAETILLENWDIVRSSPNYVQTALYLATSRTTGLAQKAILDSGDTAGMLQHVDMHWGIRTVGRVGVTRLAQLQTLEPFYKTLSEGEHGDMRIGHFFDVANELGELEWRKKHLDPLLAASDRGSCASSLEAVFASLDREAFEADQRDGRVVAFDHWFERREKELWDRSTLLGLISDWAVSRRSKTAVELLCEALMYFGERRDLELLDRLPADLQSACDHTLRDCIYDVRRRSLGVAARRKDG